MYGLKEFLFIIVLLVFYTEKYLTSEANADDSNENLNFDIIDDREGKWFGVGLVRFANIPCISSSGLIGTCYRRRQCNDIFGGPSGSCANGIGVCCVIVRTCGGFSPYNSTYFTNADYPSPITAPTTCVLTIERATPTTCQVRIDFLNFVLAQPNATGVCNTDALIVTGGAGNVPVICGDNTGQHIYVDFYNRNNIILTITTSAGDLSRIWSFLVTQIACDCPTRAPSGCLQFYNTTTGTVNSFNYGVGSNVIDSTTLLPGTRQLINQNYGICVNMLPGYCSIQWSSNGFMVSGIPNLGFDALTNGDCFTDFVVIANPSYPNGTAINSDRFCGTSFNTVRTSLKPFVLYVVTNGNEEGDVANTGFSLSFMQIACPNNYFG